MDDTSSISTPELEPQNGNDNYGAVNAQEPSETPSSDSPKEILKALDAVERDSAAIADSFASLFASLRLSLSQVSL